MLICVLSQSTNIFTQEKNVSYQKIFSTYQDDQASVLILLIALAN